MKTTEIRIRDIIDKVYNSRKFGRTTLWQCLRLISVKRSGPSGEAQRRCGHGFVPLRLFGWCTCNNRASRVPVTHLFQVEKVANSC